MINGYITVANPEGTNIVISEVLYDAPGTGNDAKREWIELYNPTNSTISLDNWILYDNVGSMDLSGSIKAEGHFVIARNATGFFELYGFYPDFEEDFALSNTGDYLILVDSQDNIVDYVEWENSTSGWDIRASGTTIRRKNSLDTDTVKDWENSLSIGDPGGGIYPTPVTTTTTTLTTTTTTTTISPTTSPTITTITTTTTLTTTDETLEATSATTRETSETSDSALSDQTNNSPSFPIIMAIIALLLIRLKRRYN